jgi:hypothetical protein
MSIDTLTIILVLSFLGVIHSAYIRRNDLNLITFMGVSVAMLGVIILGTLHGTLGN